MTDGQLLDRHLRSPDEGDFAVLVRRHADWVYSAACRMVRDPTTAEDVAQAVFLLLAQKASALRGRESIGGWLFKATRYAAAHVRRSEIRRRRHEQRAALDRAETPDDPSNATDPWRDIAPVLEDVVTSLRDADRQAVLLRYYRGKSMAHVGLALGVSEDAAKKRVAKTVQLMRAALMRRGISIPCAALAPLLLVRTTEAAPQLLIATSAAAVSTISAAGGTAVGIAKGATTMMKFAALKTAATVACVAVLSIGVGSGALVACRDIASRRSSPAQAASAPAATPAPPVAVKNAADRKIRVGDRLLIQIPDLNVQGVESLFHITVDENGRIKLPYVGLVRAAGLTQAECEMKIKESYQQANILQQAQVSVSIEEDKPRQDPRSTSEMFLKSALAGRLPEAAQMGEPGKAYSRSEKIKEFGRLNIKDLPIISVHSDGNIALAITEDVKDDRNQAGSLLVTLVKKDDMWWVRDVDLDPKDSVNGTLKTFLDAHPDARPVTAEKSK